MSRWCRTIIRILFHPKSNILHVGLNNIVRAKSFKIASNHNTLTMLNHRQTLRREMPLCTTKTNLNSHNSRSIISQYLSSNLKNFRFNPNSNHKCLSISHPSSNSNRPSWTAKKTSTTMLRFRKILNLSWIKTTLTKRSMTDSFYIDIKPITIWHILIINFNI